MTKRTINNGSRVQVEHACFTGIGGLVATEAGTFISFPVPKSAKSHPKPGDPLKVDARTVEIVSARPSQTMPKDMIVLTIVEKEPGDAVSDD